LDGPSYTKIPLFVIAMPLIASFNAQLIPEYCAGFLEGDLVLIQI
jgi:hypothetical protein